MKSEGKKTHIRKRSTAKIVSSKAGERSADLLASCLPDVISYNARMIHGLEKRKGKRNKKK